jgi:predicted flap endonuclease-1-like 5' DNA nuclease
MTLTFAQAVTVAILALSSFFCGWFLYHLRAKGREAALEKTLDQTKASIPRLESSLASREQRIDALSVEIGEWKARVELAETSSRDKDREMLARDRALRALNAELTQLREAGAHPPAVDESALVALRAELEAARQRAQELQQRLDASAAILPVGVDGPADGAQSAAISRIAALEAEVAARDRSLADMQERLSAEGAHAATLAGTIESQEARLALERDEIAKWRVRVPKLVESLKERDERLADASARLAGFEQAQLAATRRAEALEAALNATKSALGNAEQTVQAAARAQAAAEDQASALVAERLALDGRLAAHEATLAEQAGELVARTARIAELEKSAEEDRDAFSKKLATSIRLGREEIDRLGTELGGEIERLTRELGDAITRHNESIEAVAAQRAHVESLERELAAQSAVRDRADAEIGAREARIAALTTECEVARTDRDEALARIVAIESELLQRDARVSSAQDEVRAAVAARDAAAEQSARLEGRVRGLEAEREHLTARVRDVEGDLTASLAQVTAAQSGVQQAIEAARSEGSAVRADEIAALQEELRAAHARVAPLEELVRQRDLALAERAARIETLQDQLKRVDETLEARSQRVNALERTHQPASEKVEYLEQRVAAQFERNRELASGVEERDKRIGDLLRDQSLKEKSLGVLQQQLEHLNHANDRLAAELRALRDGAGELAPPESVDSGVSPERPQGLFAAPPEQSDDLKRIRGIGAAFEHRLNELGVYQIRQIAAFTDAEIAWVENELRMFRGRIGRDDWIGQALDLLATQAWPAVGLPATEQNPHRVSP